MRLEGCRMFTYHYLKIFYNMELNKLDNFVKGWVVGNFSPALIKTDKIEFAIKKYNTNDLEAKHVHKIAKEITIIISGKFKMNNHILSEGDILELNPGEISEFQCLEGGYTAVIKTPSVIDDKYLIN